jgi:hypothetical protein
MKRAFTSGMLAAAATVLFAPSASATIHPIVESADCASAKADAAHPLRDVANPPGQTPGYGSHSTTSPLRAIQKAAAPASSDHKFNQVCGHVGG